MLPDLFPLTPYLRETIWGGRGLAERYHKHLPEGRQIGESWEVSAYEGAESRVAGGPLAGQNLGDLVLAHGADLLGQGVVDRYDTAFPLLIKLLDARADLSIQVHPDDAYARAEQLGTYGKMEAWYVLRSENGRVAYGLKPEVGKADFEAALRDNRVDDTVRFFDVQAGDVVFVPPGTVHALCKNVMIYEVQQSSDLTFRLWDYNRPGADGKPRELHIDRSLDVTRFGDHAPGPRHWTALPGDAAHTELVASEHFRCERFCHEGARTHRYASFAALTVLEGAAEISGGKDAFAARPGDTFFVVAERTATVVGKGDGRVAYLISSVP